MIDIRKLYGVFVDEATERLAELEEGLLRIEKSPGDAELVNTIFRAVHTIKGSSGSLGLKDISTFTHGMEEILELVRQEKLTPGKELINVLLDAADMIREMVGCVASESVFDFGRCTDLIKGMDAIKDQDVKGQLKQHAAAGKVSGETILKKEAGLPGTGYARRFMIMFIPDQGLFKRGIDPSVIIDDLKSIGEILSIKGHTDEVPPLPEMDPENLYLRWDIQIKTDKGPEDIRKIFEFVEEGSEIKIFPEFEHEYEEYVMPIGQLLVDEGIVRNEDVECAMKTQKKLGEILVEQGKASSGDIEKVVEKQRNSKAESFRNSISSTIRVDLRKLDQLINTVGEMVIIHSMLQEAIKTDGNAKGMSGRLDLIFSQLQRIGSNIQESAMSLRMLPVGEVFQRFTRLVRELSESKNKDIELVITGEETELDKGVLEKISDPLVHLIRNAIDHGIEPPEERASKGKSEKGTVRLSAYQMGDSVYIEVSDDGRGINKGRIIEKALSTEIIKNAPGSVKDMSDEQIYNLIFMPGFSTADTVTDVSGRGVGMDVVKKNIESLNGKVYIRTKEGIGTTISIKLPLTLAIIDGLKVLIGDEVFVVPITSVVQSLRPAREDVKTLGEKGEVIHVRGEYIPLIRMYEELGVEPWKQDPWEAIVVLVAYENKKRCLLVDELVGEQQVVIKNLGKATPNVCDVAGGTILGDGKVALVLDVPGIIEKAV